TPRSHNRGRRGSAPARPRSASPFPSSTAWPAPPRCGCRCACRRRAGWTARPPPRGRRGSSCPTRSPTKIGTAPPSPPPLPPPPPLPLRPRGHIPGPAGDLPRRAPDPGPLFRAVQLGRRRLDGVVFAFVVGELAGQPAPPFEAVGGRAVQPARRR